MKHILITGAGSYIGISLEKWLQQWPGYYFVDALDMQCEDWESTDFSKYDCVIHVAGIVHRKARKNDWELYYTVNKELAAATAAKAKNEKVRLFIFLSTMSVYGKKSGEINESTPLLPNTIYGITKLLAEGEICSLSDERFKVAILRPPMVYGVGCKGNFSRLLKLVSKIRVFPLIHTKRSVIYIYRLCRIIQFIIDNEYSGYFFPQDDEYFDIVKVLNIIADKYNKKLIFIKFINPLIKMFRSYSTLLNSLFNDLYYDRSLSKNYEKNLIESDFDEDFYNSLQV